MYGEFTQQNTEHPETVLIMDLVHGGDIIGRRLRSLGYRVHCADVYKVSTEELRNGLSSEGIGVSFEVPPADYDLVISPMHCPDTFLEGSTWKERMSFSGAVGRLVGPGPFRIEVTGVKGKTSTCYAIAHILDEAGKKVYLHTSRGDGPYIGGTHVIDSLRSIAPTSILNLPGSGYDVVVSEVSLGGSAKADIAVITNLAEDYGIAKNSRRSSQAKAEVFTDGINIVMENETDIWHSYCNNIEGHRDVIKVTGEPSLGSGLDIGFTYKGKEHRAHLDGSYLSLQYLQAFDMAMSVCAHMDIDAVHIVNALTTFKGVPGRGEIESRDGAWHVTERNPGISHISVGRTLSCLKTMNALENAFAIVDPVSKKVCDKMKPQQIRDVLESYGVEYVFTDGIGRDVEIPRGKTTVIRFVKEGFQ